MEINNYIDHTLLKSSATSEQIIKLCDEAKKYKFFSVCVNPNFVSLASKELRGTNVKIACVVGFPLGQNKTEIKIAETKLAVLEGANEIDMVINISKLKEHDYGYILNEINAIKKACCCTLKVIIETSQLSDEEVVIMCNVVNKSDADCIKTSTGFVGEGANLETVKLMVDHIEKPKFVKASGGIRDYQTAKAMIDAGAGRLGVSAGVAIVEGEKSQNK